jgi:hypothetical protein
LVDWRYQKAITVRRDVQHSDHFKFLKPTFPVAKTSMNSGCDRKSSSMSHSVADHYPKETKARIMKNQLPDSPSALEPRLQTSPSSDERFTIAFWMMRYETFLFSTRPYSTYERYTRALDRLFASFPEKRFLHQFLRHDLEDFKKQRLLSIA